MKHIYLLFITLFIGSLGFAQVSENFDSFTSGGYGNYNYNNFDINNGLSESSNSRSGKAVRLKNQSNANLEYVGSDGNGKDGGVGTITFWYRSWDSSPTAEYVVESSINNGLYNQIGSSIATSSTSYAEWTHTLDDSSDDIKIRVRRTNGERLIIDDFEITDFSGPTCIAPTSQASTYNTTALGTTSATLNWTHGDGEEVLVVVKEGSAVDTDPEVGTTYTGNTTFTSGDPIGTGNYAVYSGSTTETVSITGLSEATTYHVAIYEYNTTDTCYLTPALTGSFTTEIACPTITGLSIDSFTDTTANISWTAGDTETDWEVVIQDAGTETPSGSETATTTNSPYLATGLTQNTAYEVYVRANCISDGFSTWAGPVNFTTPCGAITPPYSANMEINVPDTCWKEAGSGEISAGPGDIGNSDWRSNRSYAFGPSNAINLYQNNDREWLLSPTFDLTSGGPFQLEINVAVTNYSFSGTTTTDDSMGSDDEVQLLITTDGGITWSNLTTWNAANEPEVTGTEYIEDLSSYSGNVQFAIWASDGTIDNSEDYDFHVGKFKLGSLKDTDSHVKNPNSSIEANTIIASNVTTVATSAEAFSFIVEDLGTTDILPTNVTTMRFVPGPNNTADWSGHIQGITLYDENLVDYTPSATITDTDIILDFDTPITIANGTSLEFVLGFYLNTTNIVDESIIQFQIDAASNGFAANNNGSGFADPFSGSVIGENITIDVEAIEIAFSEQPSNTFVNEMMTPDVIVTAIDTNGNIDVNYDLDIEITSTGTLSGSPLVATSVNGVATFVGVTHTALGTALVLTADDGLYPTINSTPFDIEAIPVGPVVIAIQDFDNTTPEWTYTNEVSFFDNTWGGDGYYGIINIASASPIDYENMQGNILGENDLDDEDDYGTSGFATTTLATIDISTYNNVELTFDWDVVGYNANNDDARYEVFFDGVGQGTVYLLDGNNSDENGEGTVTISIPDTVNNISLEIEIRNNGSDGYSGFDNFKLEGEVISNSTDYTYNGTWSPSDPNGTATANDDITIASGDAIISTNTTANSVTVNPGAAITVDDIATLTVSNGLVLESTSSSFSSLILDGDISGTITYERYANAYNNGAGGGNDLIAPPLSGQTWPNFLTTGSNSTDLLDNGATAPTTYAFAPFDKSASAYVNYTDATTATLNSGLGYRVATDSGANLTFTGSAADTDVTIAIENSGSSYASWNLIGNPYPSYLDMEAFLEYATAPEQRNIDLMESGSGIYGYDGTSNGWTTYTLANASGILIAPGQGFFVASDAASADLYFTTEMRTTGSSDDFISGRNATNELTYLKLKASTANQSYNTDFYFNTNSSSGLDLGYDAKIWGGTAPSFALYSHLVEDNTGLPIALQSLNTTDLSEVSIPLGVHANQGEQLTFSIAESTLENNVNVYLDDTEANTSTLLNSEDYVLTPNSDLSGTGRFYLRTTETTLSTIDNHFDHLNIYSNKADKTIVIAGQLLAPTTMKLFDMQGRTVSHIILDNTRGSMQSIDVSNLNAGVYVVQLDNGTQLKTQKIIIN
ncbi:T9SS type A sorting domain-containing protein [Winogradskyella sp. SM1960]|uniref:T9SS type A sorting domain-containing protein n=1 Tax=Winogradskyella sp. SM1960 TaxID=2865955 RepID=UPI001CD2A6D4|nr:T9SS type A sorting domain-containing protein [Winogradskyella sp. SM1960]